MSVDWANVSVGVAAILGLIYVVREMRKVVDSTNVSSRHTANALCDLAVALGVMSERTDRLHDDNVETARLLKDADRAIAKTLEEADRDVTRKVRDQDKETP